MRLVVSTPVSVVVDTDDVAYVRAEDETGAFGVLPGHAELITVLDISVITWRNEAGEECHVAVRGGVLSVRDGSLIEVATREAIGEETLRELGSAVLQRFHEQTEAEQASRISEARLHLATMRQIQRYLNSGREPRTQPIGTQGSPRPGGRDEQRP